MSNLRKEQLPEKTQAIRWRRSLTEKALQLSHGIDQAVDILKVVVECKGGPCRHRDAETFGERLLIGICFLAALAAGVRVKGRGAI